MKPVPGPAIVATIDDLVWHQSRSIPLLTAYEYSRLAKRGKCMELYQKLLPHYHEKPTPVDLNLFKLIQVTGIAAGLSVDLVLIDMD